MREPIRIERTPIERIRSQVADSAALFALGRKSIVNFRLDMAAAGITQPEQQYIVVNRTMAALRLSLTEVT